MIDDMEEFYAVEARRRKIDALKERLRPKCRWYTTDGAGGYCTLKKDTSGMHTYYRTMCLGKLNTFCILPDKYEEGEKD